MFWERGSSDLDFSAGPMVADVRIYQQESKEGMLHSWPQVDV